MKRQRARENENENEKKNLAAQVTSTRTSKVLEVDLLDLAMLGPNDLATLIHAHGRLLASELERVVHGKSSEITITMTATATATTMLRSLP